MRQMPCNPIQVTVEINTKPSKAKDSDTSFTEYKPGDRSLHIEILGEDGQTLVIDTGPLTEEFEMTFTDGSESL